MSAAAIQAELRRLRENRGAGGGLGTLTATSTVVVHCAGAAEREATIDAARRMAMAHGARLILLDAGERAQIEVRAFSGGAESEAICCEEVRLPLVPAHPGDAVAVVEELAFPGLPCHLWWSGPGLESALFAGLRALAKHIVVDSAAAGPGPAALAELERACARTPRRRIADLSWLRTAPWREMAARLFDHPEHAGRLARLQAIEVEGGAPSEGALLIGWLAAQLGLTPAKKPGRLKGAAGERVAFTLVAPGGAGSLRGLSLVTTEITYTAAVARSGDAVTLTRSGGSGTRRRCEPLITRSPEELVSDALFGPAGDPTFARALALAAQLALP